jgi:ribonuclease P protein component
MIGRRHRFHGRNSLNFVYKKGRTARHEHITLRYTRNDRRTDYRVAVVVSRKVSKSAVVRNRIRRRIYEQVRLAEAPLRDTGWDLIFTVFHDQIATEPPDNLAGTIAMLLGRLRQDSQPESMV